MARALEHTGWLLDLYADPQSGQLTVWIIGADGVRLRLKQRFPITFYAAGRNERLRDLWAFLSAQPEPVKLARAERRDLFSPRPLTVLAVEVSRAACQPQLFRELMELFPDLDYFDADIPLFPRYAARFDVFPLTRCRVAVDPEGWIETVTPLESRWELDPAPLPLRIMTLEPDCDPFHEQPSYVHIQYGRFDFRLPLQPERPFLVGMAALLRRYDPDLLLTDWGDTWLMPLLLQRSHGSHARLPLNRDPGQPAVRKADRIYHSYGQVVFRGRQVHLHGRLHIDRKNGMMWGDYGLEGVFELARASGLPVQTAARNSPGAGITAMQIITALGQAVLVPHKKQQVERRKTAIDLIQTDRGGLVFSPLIGCYENVAEMDFVGLYPSIMRKFNLSPETIRSSEQTGQPVPGVNLFFDQEQEGLLPATLAPLLDKRIALKGILAALKSSDCRYAAYKARSSALKWLLVVCFGYTGYRNAKFGRIEAHQAITSYARDVLLSAKEVAEQAGFEVLHMYVDCLWVRKPGARQVQDFQPLLSEIAGRTGLPIALDGIFKWVAFLPSRMDPRVGVANRYFGVFQSGEIKLRGIDARRRDTVEFVAQVQAEILDRFARCATAAELADRLPEVIALLRRRVRELRGGQVEITRLISRQRLTRSLDEYRSASPSARAAAQLAAAGKTVRVGQSVRFVYTRGDPGVAAWDLPAKIKPAEVDAPRYIRLLLRAASIVVQPLGVDESMLYDWVIGNYGAGAAPGTLPTTLPLWSGRWID